MLAKQSTYPRSHELFLKTSIEIRLILWRFYLKCRDATFTVDDLESLRHQARLPDTKYYRAVELMRQLQWYKVGTDSNGHFERYWTRRLQPEDFGLTF